MDLQKSAIRKKGLSKKYLEKKLYLICTILEQPFIRKILSNYIVTLFLLILKCFRQEFFL